MTRGARTRRLKNLDLYLDLSKERVVRHVESWTVGRGTGGPGVPEGADGLARDGERIRKEPGGTRM